MLYNSRRRKEILELGILDCQDQKIEVLCLPHEQLFGCFVVSFNEAKHVGAISRH